MATIKVPYQGLSAWIPDEGVPYYSDWTKRSVHIRQGKTIYTLPSSQFKGEVKEQAPDNQEGLQWLSATYQQGNPELFKNIKPRVGEILTKTISAVNPHGVDITSSFDGVIEKSPSIQENLARAGATPEQIKSLSGAAVQNAGGAYTPEQLKTGGIISPTPQGIYTTPSGVQVDASGKVLSQPLPDVPHPNDKTFDELIKNPNLTADQKSIIKTLYDTVSKNDAAQADRLIAAFDASAQFSDPYFKAQTAMITDALTRELSANAGNLEFDEKQLSNTLKDLKESTAASTGYLDFQKTKDLEDLATNYEQELENKRQNLAMIGKTSSSVRSKAETLLSEQKEGLVEGVNRQFSYQTGQLSNKLAGAERDYPLELERLRDVNTQKRIAELRRTEGLIGSGQLSSLGYGGTDVLSGVGGDIERQKLQSALSFSNNFVF